MATNLGYKINEVSNWADWRQYEASTLINNVVNEKVDDLDYMGGNQTAWFNDSTVVANLPVGMVEGFVTIYDTQGHKGQKAFGIDVGGLTMAEVVRYFVKVPGENGGLNGHWTLWA